MRRKPSKNASKASLVQTNGIIEAVSTTTEKQTGIDFATNTDFHKGPNLSASLYDTSALRLTYHTLSAENRIDFISKLSPAAFEQFRYFSDITLRDKQIVPSSWNGRYYIAMCGRGWGKSKMGAYWIKTLVYAKQKGIAIVAPNYKDLEEVMVRAIQDEFTPAHKPKYLGGNKAKFICHNGIEILCYTSEQEIRGGNFSAIWCDELAKWCDSKQDKVEERFQVLDFACRKGKAQFLITTTPKEWDIFYKWEDRVKNGDPLVAIVAGDMDENTDLSPIAKGALHLQYDNTRIGQQELQGQLLRDNPNALWSEAILSRCRLAQQTFDKLIKDNVIHIVKSVIAVDPAVSTNPNSDETGICVSALCSDNKVYVLEDLSGKLTPEEWASTACAAYKKYNAAHIILESNQGGALLETAIKTVDRYARTKLIHASVGKKTRFEPVVMAYERQEIYHVGNLFKLERQMLSFNPYEDSDSPDRIDAVAYSIYYLLLGQRAPQYRSMKNIAAW